MQIMTHVVGGYPDMDACEQAVVTMADAGVSMVEIQIPFSDPVADGPTLTAANEKALRAGTTVEDCFQLMQRLREKVTMPLLFMMYYNIVFRYGLEAFCKRAKEVGCYGFIVPDIPIDEEEYEHYIATCKKYDLHPIQVISPITPDERLAKIGEVASGFVYCVARKGTTGVRASLESTVGAYLDRVRKHIQVPLALGFGISTPEMAKDAAKHADIVVMGSALLNTSNAERTEFLSQCLEL